MRSTRRTSKRNERERAPITIEARSATESGTASSRMRSTASRLARCARGDVRRSARSREQAAEVDDPPHARARAAAAANVSAASALALGERSRCRAAARSIEWIR